MLTHLEVKDFAILAKASLKLDSGMTVITGETGAGKSIILDALRLCLGDRAQTDSIRNGCEQMQVSATFDLNRCPQARSWLEHNQLLFGNSCTLKRTVTRQGRSRSFINEKSCSLPKLQQLSRHLISVQSQNKQYSLAKVSNQYAYLDTFANLTNLRKKVASHFHKWQQLKTQVTALSGEQQQCQAKAELVEYQLQELSQLDPQPNELESLEQQQQTLGQTDSILTTCHQVLELCDRREQGNALSLLYQSEQMLTQLPNLTVCEQALEMLNSAQIQLTEAISQIQDFSQNIEANPEKLSEIENRLSQFYQLGRKHQIAPEKLFLLREDLQKELDNLNSDQQELNQLQQLRDEQFALYYSQAKKLSLARSKAAISLTKEISAQLPALGMPGGLCHIELCQSKTHEPTAYGQEQVIFMVTTNPGHKPARLGKIASGGELSRLCLAIESITGWTSGLSCFVFDEIDSGIGGGTAERVGLLLKDLSDQAQVICVTHQPQVAACGSQHWQVSKVFSKNKTVSTISKLNSKARIQETARMLGGLKITQQTLCHAKELIASHKKGKEITRQFERQAG